MWLSADNFDYREINLAKKNEWESSLVVQVGLILPTWETQTGKSQMQRQPGQPTETLFQDKMTKELRTELSSTALV